MPSKIRLNNLVTGAFIVLTSLAVTIHAAVRYGQDFNWDQRNYHIGVPFLLEHHMFWASIDPADIQSYFNPYLLQVQFWALQHLPAIDFAILLGSVQSIAFMLAGLLCVEIARPVGGWSAIIIGLLGFALCLIAPVPLSEAGCTFIDVTTSIPVIGAYILLLARGRVLPFTAAALLAGALLGLATALKLTNATFAVAAIGFALAGTDTWRQRLRWLVLCYGALALAFIVISLPWMLVLNKHFGSPLFPFYNNIFHSPDFPPLNWHDTTFQPDSVLDVWRFPFYWLVGHDKALPSFSPTLQLHFIDARWIFAVFGLTLFVIALPFSRMWRRNKLADPTSGFMFTAIIGYLVWLKVFADHRYFIGFDIMCGAILLSLLMQLRPVVLRAGLLATLVLLSYQLMRVPDWVHLPWKPYWQAINPVKLKFDRPTIVFLLDQPILFVAASLPADTRYVGINGEFDLRGSNDTALTRQLKHDLTAEPNTPLKEIDDGTIPAAAYNILQSYGLSITSQCTEFTVGGELFHMCNIRR